MKAQVVRIDSPGNIPGWYESIKTELQGVESRLYEAVESDVATVEAISNHLLAAGGKRLRPALVVLSALAASESVDNKRMITIAAAVELIHMATLVHDDVIDHADSRRGRATANVFWGNRMSVLNGDSMLARAFRFLAEDGDSRILHVLADMTVKMTEGEALQAECERNVELWRHNYWRIIRDKTALFMSACCRIGAIVSGASTEEEDALAAYGLEMGMAFQLTDDLLDIAGDAEVVGKPVGSDLKDGKITLPVLLALDTMPEAERAAAQELMEKLTLSSAEAVGLCEAVQGTTAIIEAREKAADYVNQAIARLSVLPESSAKANLVALAEQIVERDR